MEKSNAPLKYTVPFATSGTKNAIPVAASPTPGLAAYETGFPAVTMEPIASGGVPPEGEDFNGILYDATTASLWEQAGYISAFDNTWASNTNISGYPAQSLVCRADGKGLWLNLADSNTHSPDTTGATNWLSIRGNAGSSTIAIAGATTTPDPSVLGPPLLILTGTLTANAALVLPLVAGSGWVIQNNTTGAYNVSVQGATGTGVQVSAGNPAQVYTDGTNFYATTANVSGLYLPINGNAVSASKLAIARTITLGGVLTGSESFDGSSNVTISAAFVTPPVTSFNTRSGAVTLSAADVNGLGELSLSGGLAAAGNIAATGALYGSGLNPPTAATQGPQILWNTITPGSGFMEYINNYGGGAGSHKWYARSATSGGATLQMTLDPSGNLTAGGAVTSGATVTAVQNFVSSTANWIAAPTGAGTIYFRPNGIGSTSGQCSITSSGNYNGAGTVQPGSDGRVKKNRKKITHALSEVAKLSGLIYERSDRKNEIESGFIAQNVERHFPHLVTKNKEMNGFKNFRTLNYNGIIPYLANAINELHAQVSKTFRAVYVDMRRELRERDKKIASLERRLEKLEKAMR